MLAPQRFHAGPEWQSTARRLAAGLAAAGWVLVWGGFLAEVSGRRDPVDRLYQMDAARDQLARKLARTTEVLPREAPRAAPVSRTS